MRHVRFLRRSKNCKKGVLFRYLGGSDGFFRKCVYSVAKRCLISVMALCTSSKSHHQFSPVITNEQRFAATLNIWNGMTLSTSLLANIFVALFGATVMTVYYYESCEIGFCTNGAGLSSDEPSAIEAAYFPSAY